MKKALAMAMSTCLLATSMVGCGGNTSTPAGSTGAEGTPAASEAVDTSSVLTDNAEIRFCWWGGDDRHTATLAAIRRLGWSCRKNYYSNDRWYSCGRTSSKL